MQRIHFPYKNRPFTTLAGILFVLLIVAFAGGHLSVAMSTAVEDQVEDTLAAPGVGADTTAMAETAVADSLADGDMAPADIGAPLDDPTDSLAGSPVAAEANEAIPTGPYTKTELRKGERLFKGLLAFESGLHNCASCHYPSRTDTLNWNPSAYDLAVAWEEGGSSGIKAKLDSPLGMRMMNDHLGMTITAAEERQLEAYLTALLEDGPGDLRAIPVNAVIFWGLGLIMALALIDLLITKKIKVKAFHMLIIIAGLVVHMQYAVAESRALGRTEGYAPDQPIKFSHLVHAGENEIDCNYCHTIANFSLSAGIPSNNTCLNCHNVVREGTRSGRFEINKIHRAEATGEAVRWIRIHKLPDHSFFSHAQHVNAGGIECQDCHGPVEEMHIVRQEEDLSMGWCLTCHRETEVDFLDNPYYQIYKSLHEDMKAGRIDSVTAARVGGEDCMKCHY